MESAFSVPRISPCRALILFASVKWVPGDDLTFPAVAGPILPDGQLFTLLAPVKADPTDELYWDGMGELSFPVVPYEWDGEELSFPVSYDGEDHMITLAWDGYEDGEFFFKLTCPEGVFIPSGPTRFLDKDTPLLWSFGLPDAGQQVCMALSPYNNIFPLLDQTLSPTDPDTGLTALVAPWHTAHAAGTGAPSFFTGPPIMQTPAYGFLPLSLPGQYPFYTGPWGLFRQGHLGLLSLFNNAPLRFSPMPQGAFGFEGGFQGPFPMSLIFMDGAL